MSRETITFKVTPEFKKRIRKYASERNLTITGFITYCFLEEEKRILDRKSK